MIVVCRRTECDQTVHTPLPETEPYCGPECARADRVAVVLSPGVVPMPKIAHLVTVTPELLGDTPPDLIATTAYKLQQACVRALADQLQQACVRALADQLDPAHPDTATVTADLYAATTPKGSVYQPPEPGWLARTLGRWL